MSRNGVIFLIVLAVAIVSLAIFNGERHKRTIARQNELIEWQQEKLNKIAHDDADNERNWAVIDAVRDENRQAERARAAAAIKELLAQCDHLEKLRHLARLADEEKQAKINTLLKALNASSGKVVSLQAELASARVKLEEYKKSDKFMNDLADNLFNEIEPLREKYDQLKEENRILRLPEYRPAECWRRR